MTTRPVKTLEELERLVLADLRKDPEAAGIRSVKAYLHESDSAGSNWNIYRFEAGSSHRDRCQAAIRRISQRLRREFNATEAKEPETELETRPIQARRAQSLSPQTWPAARPASGGSNDR
jgi:hypothetical protein